MNLKKRLENVRAAGPLVHNITNYVTVNDCANILLACGGSPIMADDMNEAADITAICGGLHQHRNPQRTDHSVNVRGRPQGEELGHPVLLDPVGAGLQPTGRKPRWDFSTK